MRSAEENKEKSASERGEAVVGGVLVGVGERRVIEDHVDEQIDRAAELDGGLADVHELAGALADHVDADDLARFALDDELGNAVEVAGNLAARIVLVERAA